MLIPMATNPKMMNNMSEANRQSPISNKMCYIISSDFINYDGAVQTHIDRNLHPIRFSSIGFGFCHRFRYNRQWRRATNKIPPGKVRQSWLELML
jgi:hypothetical protein